MSESMEALVIDEGAVLSELSAVRAQSAKELRFEFLDKVLEIQSRLQELYPNENLVEYKLFHLLIGSTPDNSVNKFDLPDGGIEKAIRSLQSRSE